MSATKAASSKESSGIERRKERRTDVLETFSVFLVIPAKGDHKIYLRDVSAGGLGFYAEATDAFVSGETVAAFFHINPALKLPLTLKIVHALKEENENGLVRIKIGCEFGDTSSKGYKAYTTFIDLLDQLSEFVEGR